MSLPSVDEDWREFVQHVEGWLSEAEGQALYKLAKQCTGRGAIVEIGSWKGRSTIWLAKGSEAGQRATVYAIDPHSGITAEEPAGTQSTLATFRENVRRAHCDSLVVPLVMTSAQAAAGFQEPVELVFIDASHDEDMIQKDFNLWFPKLVEGGMIALHDTIVWPGPKRVAKRMIYRSKYFRDVRFAHSLTYAQKTSPKGFGLSTRIRSEYTLFAKRMYETLFRLNLILRVKPLIKLISERLR